MKEFLPHAVLALIFWQGIAAGGDAPVTASFRFPDDASTGCGKSAAASEFLDMLTSLRELVGRVVIESGPGTDSCGRELASLLAGRSVRHEVTSGSKGLNIRFVLLEGTPDSSSNKNENPDSTPKSQANQSAKSQPAPPKEHSVALRVTPAPSACPPGGALGGKGNSDGMGLAATGEAPVPAPIPTPVTTPVPAPVSTVRASSAAGMSGAASPAVVKSSEGKNSKKMEKGSGGSLFKGGNSSIALSGIDMELSGGLASRYPEFRRGAATRWLAGFQARFDVSVFDLRLGAMTTRDLTSFLSTTHEWRLEGGYVGQLVNSWAWEGSAGVHIGFMNPQYARLEIGELQGQFIPDSQVAPTVSAAVRYSSDSFSTRLGGRLIPASLSFPFGLALRPFASFDYSLGRYWGVGLRYERLQTTFPAEKETRSLTCHGFWASLLLSL